MRVVRNPHPRATTVNAVVEQLSNRRVAVKKDFSHRLAHLRKHDQQEHEQYMAKLKRQHAALDEYQFTQCDILTRLEKREITAADAAQLLHDAAVKRDSVV